MLASAFGRNYPARAPDLVDLEVGSEIQHLGLESLVRMKLTSYRTKDRVHWLDMIDVG
jgi:hypothetical protein